MVSEQTIHGTILYGPELELIEGYMVIRDGIITEVAGERTDSKNIIAPCFVNAHTHIGDSVIKDPVLGKCVDHYVERDLGSLVQPPHGLKHRVLEATPRDELMEGMRRSVTDMIQTGTCAFADFREGGIEGILALKEALQGFEIECRILGRPKRINAGYDELCSEVERILMDADGLGMSGANDMDMHILGTIGDIAKSKQKILAIHAGEDCRGDIEKALSLDPDILIHLTKADRNDLKKVADVGIPAVVCPRSNFITGAGMAPVRDMLNSGIDVAVGTDNVMLNSVNMFSEMEFLSKIFGLEDRQVFIMCTLMGAAILGLDKTGAIIERNRAKVMILNGNSCNLAGIKNPINSIVRRGRPDDILSVII
ncbi:MAG: amidohydrolase family protein [Methanosarcinaceae archaeon]|nr:amidohydrolase family protein [Methanosarcinaceae archaeon]